MSDKEKKRESMPGWILIIALAVAGIVAYGRLEAGAAEAVISGVVTFVIALLILLLIRPRRRPKNDE
jgi:hypothetical protein